MTHNICSSTIILNHKNINIVIIWRFPFNKKPVVNSQDIYL